MFWLHVKICISFKALLPCTNAIILFVLLTKVLVCWIAVQRVYVVICFEFHREIKNIIKFVRLSINPFNARLWGDHQQIESINSKAKLIYSRKPGNINFHFIRPALCMLLLVIIWWYKCRSSTAKFVQIKSMKHDNGTQKRWIDTCSAQCFQKNNEKWQNIVKFPCTNLMEA